MIREQAWAGEADPEPRDKVATKWGFRRTGVHRGGVGVGENRGRGGAPPGGPAGPGVHGSHKRPGPPLSHTPMDRRAAALVGLCVPCAGGLSPSQGCRVGAGFWKPTAGHLAGTGSTAVGPADLEQASSLLSACLPASLSSPVPRSFLPSFFPQVRVK